MYVTVEYYKDTYKGNLDEADAEKALKQASRHIDTLTYNRIVDKGFENLTDFQQGIIKECVCMTAEWETENIDYINSMLSSYSLNGASMTFTGNSAGAVICNGIVVSREIYSHLQKCGLCTRSLRGC